MLERMREFSKSWMMKGLLGLVGLSFILYFGSVPFQKRQQERLYSAVKVNGEIISTQEFLRVYNRLREELEEDQGWPLNEQQQREIARSALDALIDQKLQMQWSTQAGLKATDEEISRRISDLWGQITGGRPLTERAYRALLAHFNYRSIAAFENDIRRNLIQEKMAALLAQRVKVSEPQLRGTYALLRRQLRVAAVTFLPEDYMGQVEPTREELVRYYKGNQEQYRQPERVQVDYIETRPEDLRDEVSLVESRLQQFFARNQSRYLLERKAAVDYVRFHADRFEEQAIPNEEEIQRYHAEHADRYLMPERIKVRYVPMAVQDALGVNAPTEGMLQAERLSNQKEYEQVEASLILLRFPEKTTSEEEKKVLEELNRIRREIEQGKDFGVAAQEYSQDETAADEGRLGFVRRGQLPRPLNQTLFSLGVGQMSKPIRGITGYYLLKAHGKHLVPLEEVREDVARRVASSRLTEIVRKTRNNVLPENYHRGLRVLSTDFFEQGKYISDTIGSDYYAFSEAAFRLADAKTSGVVRGRRNYYVISRIETHPAQKRPLEEVREEIIRDIQAERAPEVARQKAGEALEMVRKAGLSFEEMAARFELEILNSGYFGQSDSPASLGPNPYLFVWTAFNLKPDEVSDVVTLESGFYLLRGKPLREARLPQLEEVREQVEADFRRERAVDKAREQAEEYLARIQDQELSLRDLARSEQLEVHDSGLFGMDESVPNLKDPKNLFHRAAFSIVQVGEILWDAVPVTFPGSDEAQAVYVLQLTDRAPSYIPPFTEVIDKVTENQKRQMAAELARQDGEACVKELQAADVPSASPPFDLRQFADQQGYESFETPFFGQLGYVPGIAGTEDSPEFTRTAFSLEPGECSGLVAVREKVDFADTSKEAPQWRLTGYYVLQLLERQESDFADLEAQRQSLVDQMLQVRRQRSYRSWLDGLRSGAEIVRNEAFLGDYERGGLTEEAEAETEAGPETEP